MKPDKAFFMDKILRIDMGAPGGLKAVTTGLGKYKGMGGRGMTSMEREFNRKAGFSAAHDRLPRFFRREPLAPHNVVFDVSDQQLDTLFNW